MLESALRSVINMAQAMLTKQDWQHIDHQETFCDMATQGSEKHGCT